MAFFQVFLMIIAKIYKIISIITFVAILFGCNEFDEITEPAFKVYGDAHILDKMIINIENIINDAQYPGYSVSKIQTQLYKGKQQSFINSDVVSYSIYVSYENKVNQLKFDNILNNQPGHINYLYVFKKDDQIYIKYYGLKTYIQEEIAPTISITFSLEEYFKDNNILDHDEQKSYRARFFDFHDPNIQEYRLVPLEQDTIAHFKNLSLADKINYHLPADYLKQMNLPEDELKILLMTNYDKLGK